MRGLAYEWSFSGQTMYPGSPSRQGDGWDHPFPGVVDISKFHPHESQELAQVWDAPSLNANRRNLCAQFTDNGQIIFPKSDYEIFSYPNPPPDCSSPKFPSYCQVRLPCQRTARIYFPKNCRTDISEFTHCIPGDVLICNLAAVSGLTWHSLEADSWRWDCSYQRYPVQRKQRVTILVQSPTGVARWPSYTVWSPRQLRRLILEERVHCILVRTLSCGVSLTPT